MGHRGLRLSPKFLLRCVQWPQNHRMTASVALRSRTMSCVGTCNRTATHRPTVQQRA